jgi:hypothetical protein
MVATNCSSSSTMVAANSQWLVPTICCTCNGNNPTHMNIIQTQYHQFKHSFNKFQTSIMHISPKMYPFHKIKLKPSLNQGFSPLKHKTFEGKRR